MTELNYYRKSIVLTVYYALKANDDQGEESRIQSLTMRRALEHTQLLPSQEQVDQAKKAAEELAKAQLKFKWAGSRKPIIKNIVATIEFDCY